MLQVNRNVIMPKLSVIHCIFMSNVTTGGVKMVSIRCPLLTSRIFDQHSIFKGILHAKWIISNWFVNTKHLLIINNSDENVATGNFFNWGWTISLTSWLVWKGSSVWVRPMVKQTVSLRTGGTKFVQEYYLFQIASHDGKDHSAESELSL